MVSNEKSWEPEHKATNRRRTEKMNKLKEYIGQKGKDTIIDRNQLFLLFCKEARLKAT